MLKIVKSKVGMWMLFLECRIMQFIQKLHDIEKKKKKKRKSNSKFCSHSKEPKYDNLLVPKCKIVKIQSREVDVIFTM